MSISFDANWKTEIQKPQEKIDSFLLIGQSNMAGRGLLEDALEINKERLNVLRMGRWQKLFRPVNPDRRSSGVCLAESFAEAYAREHEDVEVGLIPCADGGTTISQWLPGELNYDHALMQAKLAMRTSRLTAILWHQGESDCIRDEDVAAYRGRFHQVITSLRRDLGRPDLPVIIGQLHQDIGENWKTQGREKQLNAILNDLVRELPYCAIASSQGLTVKPDGIHFDSASCRDFGKRYFQAMQGQLGIANY